MKLIDKDKVWELLINSADYPDEVQEKLFDIWQAIIKLPVYSFELEYDTCTVNHKEIAIVWEDMWKKLIKCWAIYLWNQEYDISNI